MLHQVAGHFVHASPCTQRWPSTTHLLSSPIAPVVITLGVFDDSVMDSSRVVLCLHPSSVGQGFLELFETSARSVAVALHGNLKHHQLFGAEPLSLLPLKRLARHLSFNLDASFFLCAAAHKTISRATVTNQCQQQQRTTVTARVRVKVTTSIAQTAVALASTATSTSRCQNQQNCDDQMLTGALVLFKEESFQSVDT